MPYAISRSAPPSLPTSLDRPSILPPPIVAIANWHLLCARAPYRHIANRFLPFAVSPLPWLAACVKAFMGPPKVAGDTRPTMYTRLQVERKDATQENRTAAQALLRRRRLSLFRRTDMLAHSALSSDSSRSEWKSRRGSERERYRI